jgi:hypothetical protein
MPTAISLLDLPVEMLHCICDHLDILTILRSFCYVCKQVYNFIKTYNRYKLNIISMSISDLKFISHQIQSESIISLVISCQYKEPHPFDFFRCIFDMGQFTRLHSLILLDIKDYDDDARYFFEHICFFQV